MTIAAPDVLRAARLCRPWTEGANKIYLCDLADALGAQLETIGSELLALDRAGEIDLCRADMVAAFDADKLRRSQLDSMVFGGYQLLRTA